jgi:hypothetical protein
MNAALAQCIVAACRVLHDPASPGAAVAEANHHLIDA